MDLYTFKVDSFIIDYTRALHNDTLWLGYSAYVNGGAVAQKLVFQGDFNSGTFVPNDPVGSNPNAGLGPVVINDPTATVAFNFQLVNAGNEPTGQLRGQVGATGNALAAGAKAIGEAVGGPVGIAVEAMATLYAWLNKDCDGPVAVDQLSGLRYVLDARADQTTDKKITFVNQEYDGTPSPSGCGQNSRYWVSWSLQHQRRWLPVDAATPHLPLTGLTAATHNGAVHAVGLDMDGPSSRLSSYRTFTGATWDRFVVPSPAGLSAAPLSAVSFNDRLYVFAVHADGSVKTRVFTVDGGSWTPFTSGPSGLQTTLPFATVEFRNRLYIFARDSATNRLRLTSTDDMLEWSAWSDVPEPPGIPHEPALAAVSLGGLLHVFGVYRPQGSPSSDRQILHNSTTDAATWTGWRSVERAAMLPGSFGGPLDVAANIFQNRIYLASRWELAPGAQPGRNLAVNFSADGENWSGWRVPESDINFQAEATATLAPVNNHLYLFTLGRDTTAPPGSPTLLFVY